MGTSKQYSHHFHFVRAARTKSTRIRYSDIMDFSPLGVMSAVRIVRPSIDMRRPRAHSDQQIWICKHYTKEIHPSPYRCLQFNTFKTPRNAPATQWYRARKRYSTIVTHSTKFVILQIMPAAVALLLASLPASALAFARAACSSSWSSLFLQSARLLLNSVFGVVAL